jgi:hypothetical protein
LKLNLFVFRPPRIKQIRPRWSMGAIKFTVVKLYKIRVQWHFGQSIQSENPPIPKSRGLKSNLQMQTVFLLCKLSFKCVIHLFFTFSFQKVKINN